MDRPAFQSEKAGLWAIRARLWLSGSLIAPGELARFLVPTEPKMTRLPCGGQELRQSTEDFWAFDVATYIGISSAPMASPVDVTGFGTGSTFVEWSDDVLGQVALRDGALWVARAAALLSRIEAEARAPERRACAFLLLYEQDEHRPLPVLLGEVWFAELERMKRVTGSRIRERKP